MPASSEAHEAVDQTAERSVILPKHLHARPAGQVTQAAARFADTTIDLAAGTRRANARSVLSVMGLGAVTGSEVRIIAAGPSAAAAADEICRILAEPETDD